VTSILEIRNAEVRYGKIAAVRDLNIRIDAGQTVTIIGANGAGKSTLLNSIAGLLPASGEYFYDGKSLAGTDTEARIEQGLCLVPERRELFSTMTVEDNLRLGAFVKRRDAAACRAQLQLVYRRFPRLAERRNQPAGTLSGGERQMLALGRALMAQPRLLMLDEPSLGLAPLLVREIFEIIRGLRETGVAILLIEQNARAALESAEYCYVMETGEIAFHGPAAELIHDDRVSASYLGGSRSSPGNSSIHTPQATTRPQWKQRKF
jgi:branched-chain amino acid transport system ATP-binding protein